LAGKREKRGYETPGGTKGTSTGLVGESVQASCTQRKVSSHPEETREKKRPGEKRDKRTIEHSYNNDLPGSLGDKKKLTKGEAKGSCEKRKREKNEGEGATLLKRRRAYAV